MKQILLGRTASLPPVALNPTNFLDPQSTQATWQGAGKPIADAKLIAPLNDPAKVAKACQGEKLPEPVFPK